MNRISRIVSRVRARRAYHAHPSTPHQSFPLYKPPPPPTSNTENGEPPFSFDPYKSPHLLPTDESLNRSLKLKLTSKVTEHVPPYTEDILRAFYKNLVISGNELLLGHESGVPEISAPGSGELGMVSLGQGERRKVLDRLRGRLDGVIQSRLGNTGQSIASQREGGLHHQLAGELAALTPASSTSESSLQVPIGLASQTEWEALLQEYIAMGDTPGAERLLDVMNAHGVAVEEKYFLAIMETDAASGRVERVQQSLKEIELSNLPILPKHHDLLLRSYLQTSPPRVNDALSHIRHFESLSTPLPQSSYSLILTHLLQPSHNHLPNSQTRATALDLFTHMQLVAHPSPSPQIWRTMIRSCGDPRDPQPERGRDWFVTMCDSGVLGPAGPGREEYEAVMRALSSTKETYLEGFDLLREMLGKHYDGNFVPFEDDPPQPSSSSSSTMKGTRRYVPTVDTFKALLEGTKRAGDVNRARWILTEVVKLLKADAYTQDEVGGVDEELMSGVFMTYAAWKPLVKRGGVKAKSGTTADIEGKEVVQEGMIAEEEDGFGVDMLSAIRQTSPESALPITPESNHQPTSSSTTPQSSSDAIRESTLLFQQILNSQTSSTSPFNKVKLTTRLVNSYLSVHLAHSSSLESARAEWESAWKLASSTVGYPIKPNGWSYLAILDHCASGTRGRVGASTSRQEAYEWGRSLWREYLSFTESTFAVVENHRRNGLSEEKTKKLEWDAGLSPRQIEKAWISSIRLSALSNQLPESLALLNEFQDLYPASSITNTYKPYPLPSLEIRFTSPFEIAEPDVPPHIIWKDVDVLHQRLVRDEDWVGVGRVKWICLGYEKGLEKRRKWRFGGVGVGRERREMRIGGRRGGKRLERVDDGVYKRGEAIEGRVG